MSEAMKKFLEEMVKNVALQAKLQDSKSPEEAFAAAKEMVDDLEFDEFTSVMTQLKELSLKSNDEELGDEDLQMVAGGWSEQDTHTTLYAVIGVLGLGTAIPLAAMAAL